jgi:hypothetical protein
MGVSRCDYLLLGIKLTTKQGHKLFGEDLEKMEPYDDNPYEEKITRKNGLTAIFDGMCGKYCFIGKVLKKHRDCDEGWEPMQIWPDPTAVSEKEATEVYEKLVELLKDHAWVFRVRLWLFSHWH